VRARKAHPKHPIHHKNKHRQKPAKWRQELQETEDMPPTGIEHKKGNEAGVETGDIDAHFVQGIELIYPGDEGEDGEEKGGGAGAEDYVGCVGLSSGLFSM
jgi:hypothetical protein